MSILLVVACALVDADRRVLIAQRPQGKAMAWDDLMVDARYMHALSMLP